MRLIRLCSYPAALGTALCFASATLCNAATFTVTNTSDSGPGSLRAAIQSANLAAGTGNRVEFNIPGDGIHTIVLAAGNALIATRAMTIDGFTQPGAKPNSLTEGIDAVLRIQIRGELRLFADNCTARGLVINNSAITGLSVQGTGCVVEGCFIGTDPTGMVGLGNDLEGIRVAGFRAGTPNRIGGTTPAARNLISGNQMAGITVQSTAVGTIIQGNYIGTDATGHRPLGNGEYGIRVFGNDNADAASTLGGFNPNEGNRIAFNGVGVWVGTGTRCRIAGNSFFQNLAAGIDIGASGSGTTLLPDGETDNDTGDADTGANGLQNRPVITAVSTATGSTQIQVTLQSKPATTYRIEFFANRLPDPQVMGEGEEFLGASDVTTDASGNASTTASFPGTHAFISATATDPDGNTSEFSRVLLPPRGTTAPGDIFVSGHSELVQHFAADGTLVDILRTEQTGRPTYGMAFDPAGNLFVTGRENSAVSKFDQQGTFIGAVNEASDGFSWYIRIDAAGNSYVSSTSGSIGLRKFAPNGTLLQEIDLPRDGFAGATSFDITPSGDTIYYALEGTTFLGTVLYENRIRRFDLIANKALADFGNLPGNVRSIELLADGTLLAAVESEILRLNSQGQIVQRYDFFGEDAWSALAKGADDESFWAGGDESPRIFRFDLASGEMQQRIFIGAVAEPSLVVKRGTVPPVTPGSPSTFTVTNTSDNGAGSLRAAIEAANATQVQDTIRFAITGAGPHAIRLTSPLPLLLYSAVIDGYTQAGAQANNSVAAASQVLQIVLDGSAAGPTADGLVFAGSGSIVKGLAIIRFAGNGIVLSGGGGSQVLGNYVGIDPAGNIAANQKNGILINDSWLNRIGSSTPDGVNLIAGNGGAGVAFEGASSGGTVLAGNFIGVGRTIEVANGNHGAGVLVTQSDNQIVDNLIAFNHGAGVEVFGSVEPNRFRVWRFQDTAHVKIGNNRIYANGGLGIDLMPSGVNLNDEGGEPDDDEGPNHQLNYPRLDPPLTGSQSVTGDWTSPQNSNVTIELFASTECDPSGFGEGQTFLGRAEGNTDAQGRARFTVNLSRTLIEGEFITAIAIAQDGDTSEFSPCQRVSQPAELELSIAAAPGAPIARSELTYTLTIRNNGPGAASNVRLTNTVPARTEFVSTSTGCDVDFRDVVTCEWPTLASGQTVSATLTVRPDFASKVRLVAGVAAAELDPNLANNTAVLETVVTGEARTLSVTSTNDAGPGSLRAAIEQANASGSGLDTIAFDIPGAGIRIIKPSSELPRIQVPIIIDGYTQPGARPNTAEESSDAVILIELQGSPPEQAPGGGIIIGSGVANGLQLMAPGSTVRGLCINSCGQTGIRIDVRDPSPTDSPVLIEGCFIGTDAVGFSAKGNRNFGIALDSGQARIGGLSPAARNVISGNGNSQQGTGTGISVGFTAAAVIQGNLIGTDAGGLDALGNVGSGIELRANPPFQSSVGGREPGAGNVIAFNGGSGVSGHDHTVVGNSIYANGALGIGGTRPTPNDAGDPLESDSGSAYQNYPQLSPLIIGGGSTHIRGMLASRPNETFTIDFYANSEPDDQFFGEGEVHLGSRQVTTDAAGTAVIETSFSGRQANVSATATDQRGRTSEFSAIATSSGEQTVAAGDIFIALDTGFVQWRRSNGSWAGLLDTGLHPESIIQATSGAAVDTQGRLFVSGRPILQRGAAMPISLFDAQGHLVGAVGESGTRPSGLTVDAAGNLLAASPEAESDLTIYNSAGQLVRKVDLPNEPGTDGSGEPAELTVQWIELAADQRTLYYSSEGFFLGSPSKQIKRFDLVSNAALPDFSTILPGSEAQQFRLLPDGGGILANLDLIVRLNASGQQARTYDAESEDLWSHIALAGDGKSFWAAGRGSLGPKSILYRFDLDTGEILSRISVGGDTVIHAIAVAGSAGQAPAPSLTVLIGNNRRVRINWPASAVDFVLESTPSLSPPVTWSPVTPAPVVENGEFILRTQTTDAVRFFRLRRR